MEAPREAEARLVGSGCERRADLKERIEGGTGALAKGGREVTASIPSTRGELSEEFRGAREQLASEQHRSEEKLSRNSP